MENNTKKCPFCGEEIMSVAKKCKHCGEWIDKEETSKTKECPICGETIPESATKCEHCGENLDSEFCKNDDISEKIKSCGESDKWKKRFEAIDKWKIDGIAWKDRPSVKSLPKDEQFALTKIVFLSDIPSTVSAVLFGGFYYLAKGMWLKMIVYVAIILILIMLSGTIGIIGNLIWLFAPFDYYRLKVLGKQW